MTKQIDQLMMLADAYAKAWYSSRLIVAYDARSHRKALHQALEAALNNWKQLSITELAAETHSAMEYCSHWEGRALKAEAALKPVEPMTDTLGSEWTPCVKLPITVHVRNQRKGEKHVSTREGITPVKPDDLIMRGVAGEEYPIGQKLFEQTYKICTTPQAKTPLPRLTDMSGLRCVITDLTNEAKESRHQRERLVASLRAASNYIDALGGISKTYRQLIQEVKVSE